MTTSPPRALTPERVRFYSACIVLLTLSTIVAVYLRVDNGKVSFGPSQGPDFTSFYVAGKIHNAGGSPYDRDLHTRLTRELFPNVPKIYLPYLYPPYVAALFGPLARLPHDLAFALWMAVLIGIYAAGVWLMWREYLIQFSFTTVLLAALAFELFIVDSLANGQMTAFAFLFLALFIVSMRRERYAHAGLALALCSFKPTLLILIIPCLLIQRRFKTLAAFAVGCAAILAASFALSGFNVHIEYIEQLRYYSQVTARPGVLRLPKYADLTTFLSLLGFWGWPRYVSLACAVLSLIFLRKLKGDCLWSAAIACTLVFNVYVPVYDDALLLLPVIAMSPLLWRDARFKILVGLLYAVPWITQWAAREFHVQPLTLVALAFAVYLSRHDAEIIVSDYSRGPAEQAMLSS